MIDTALEATVVGSYSRIGPAVRRRLYHWDRNADLTAGRSSHGGHVRHWSGGSGGTGRGREPDCASSAVTLTCSSPLARRLGNLGVTRLRKLRISRISHQVRDLAGRIARAVPRVDVLLNNAGALFRSRADRGGRASRRPSR